MSDLASMTTKQALRHGRRVFRSCCVGMVVEASDDTIDGVPVTIKKIRKFNRKKLMNPPKVKEERHAGDCSIIRTGRPGSVERHTEYVKFYELNAGNEQSPFMGEYE